MAQHHLRRGAYYSGRLCDTNRAGGGHHQFTPLQNSWDVREQQESYSGASSDFNCRHQDNDGDASSSSSTAYAPVFHYAATPFPSHQNLIDSKVEKRASSLSPQYINITLEPSSYLKDPTSQRKLLILDLNGTLVFRSPHRPKSKRFNPYSDPTAQQQRPLRAVHPRPFLTPFRQYLFHQRTRSWLDTMVWSSAQPHSVADMVERSFGDKKRDLVAVWARDTLDLSAEEYNRKTQTTKDLEKPWSFFSSSHLSSEDAKLSATAVHSAHTTLLLDDSPLKAHLQPWNHLCIKEYVADMRAADVAAALTMSLLKVSDLSARSEEAAVVPIKAAAAVTEEGTKSCSEEQHRVEEESRKWKRQYKKMALTTPQSSHSSEGERSQDDVEDGEEKDTVRWWRKFDCTLLAIVGILDTVKRESNVAAWVRKGGLWKSPSSSEGLGLAPPHSGDIAPPEAIHDQKRLRGGGLATAYELMEGGDLWFGDESTKTYWIAKGVRALRELDIDVDAGVKVP